MNTPGVKVQLVHIVAPTTPLWAVFADEQGNPRFEPVVALGTMEYAKGETYKRLVSGFSAGDHIESCDWKPEFVGYTTKDPEKDFEIEMESSGYLRLRGEQGQAADHRPGARGD